MRLRAAQNPVRVEDFQNTKAFIWKKKVSFLVKLIMMQYIHEVCRYWCCILPLLINVWLITLVLQLSTVFKTPYCNKISTHV